MVTDNIVNDIDLMRMDIIQQLGDVSVSRGKVQFGVDQRLAAT